MDGYDFLTDDEDTAVPGITEPYAATTLRVVTPNVRSFRASTAGGDTLVVTQTGVSVPEGDVDSLIADAARSGVTLERSK